MHEMSDQPKEAAASPPKPLEEATEAPAQPDDTSSQDWFSAGTSWGSSWLKSATQKTFETLEFVKKDLNEFKDAVTTEVSGMTAAAKEGLENVGATVKQQAQILEKLVTPDEEERPLEHDTPQKAKTTESSSLGLGWVKTFVTTVQSLGIKDTTDDDDAYTETIRPIVLRKTMLPMGILRDIQSADSTFLEEPKDSKTFSLWLQKFEIVEHDGEINWLLENNEGMRATFARLVPAKVNADDFWKRYFYKVEIAEIDQEMKHTLQGLELSEDQKLKIETQRSEPTSGARSADDWSLCDNQPMDIEELATNGSDTEKEDVSDSPKKDSPADSDWVKESP